MDSLTLQKIRIPSILAVVMVVIMMAGIVVGTQNIGQIKKIFSSADEGSVPSNPVGVANITDNSFTAFWTTGSETAGAVFYGKTASLGDGVAVDDRALTDPNGKYTTHFVRVSGLSEKTKYYFKVGVSEATSGDQSNNGAPYEVTTGTQISGSQTIDPIFGKANKPSGSAASGAIVTWQSVGAAKIATLVKSDGSYVLPIATARSSDLSSHFSLKDGLVETINLNLAAEGTSVVQCTFGADKPLPTVTLGKNIDCNDPSSPVATPSASVDTATPPSSETAAAHFTVPAKTSPSPVGSSSESTEKLNIVSGQSVSTPFPTISGKVGPKQMVKIEIHSEIPYDGTVIADPDGSWSWTPPAGLTPGEHTVKITIVNTDGTTQVITRNFTVSSGESILPLVSGTPSGEISHLACVKSACTSVSGTGVDSCSTSSDCVVSPSTTPPVTGAGESTMLVLILGAIFLLLSGGFLIFNL